VLLTEKRNCGHNPNKARKNTKFCQTIKYLFPLISRFSLLFLLPWSKNKSQGGDKKKLKSGDFPLFMINNQLTHSLWLMFLICRENLRMTYDCKNTAMRQSLQSLIMGIWSVVLPFFSGVVSMSSSYLGGFLFDFLLFKRCGRSDIFSAVHI